MAKSKRTKKSKPKKEIVNPNPKQEVDNVDNPFDFGGLPKRDLKKNLGCG